MRIAERNGVPPMDPWPDAAASFPQPPNAKQLGGYTRIPHRVLFDPRLNAHDILVYLAVAYHAWGDVRSCWPSNERIAKLARISVASVKRTLVRLEAFGILTRTTVPNADGTNATKRMLALTRKYLPDQWITVAEAKRILRMTRDEIQVYCNQGLIGVYKIPGRRTKLRRNDVEQIAADAAQTAKDGTK